MPFPAPIQLQVPSAELTNNSAIQGLRDGISITHLLPSQQFIANSCECMKTQSTNLCSLRVIERQRVSVRGDTILTCTQTVCTTAADYLSCMPCQTDANPIPTLYMILLTFHLLFRLARSATHPSDTPCPSSEEEIRFQIGQYDVSTEEVRAVKGVLLGRALERTQKTLQCLRERVEKAARELTERHTQANNDLGPGWDFEAREIKNVVALSEIQVAGICDVCEQIQRQ